MTKTYWIPILCSSSLFVIILINTPGKRTRSIDVTTLIVNATRINSLKYIFRRFSSFFPIVLAASVVDAVLNPIAGISVIVSA